MSICLKRVASISCPVVERPLINTLLQQGDHRLKLLTNCFSGFRCKRQTAEAVVRCSSLRESSVRSAMFIANVPGDSQAPLGAACDDDQTARRPMPLLTELEPDSVRWPFYKHGAPHGAFAQTGQCELSGLVELGKSVPRCRAINKPLLAELFTPHASS